MDGVQLRDEAAQDRVRAAIEFLDPRKSPWAGLCGLVVWELTHPFFQVMMPEQEGPSSRKTSLPVQNTVLESGFWPTE